MTKTEIPLNVGDWYVVAGKGPMRLELLDDPPKRLTLRFCTPFHGPIGYCYWASREQVVRLVDQEFLNTYRADSAARNLATEGLNEVQHWLWAKKTG